jgi:site-specific DNA recombinase
MYMDAEPTVMAVYARRSRKDELRPGEQETSTEQQIRACLKLAADHGWFVPDDHIYTEAGKSAYLRGVVRGRFDDMVAAVESRQVAGVVVWKLDRASRNSYDTARMSDLLDGGAIIASVLEGVINPSDPMGAVRIEQQGVFNKMVARAIQINTQRGKEARARSGKPAGGGLRRFGFEPDQVTHREVEAELLRDAAKRLLAGESSSSIVKSWNRAGVRMVGGSMWHVTSLRRTLTNPRIAGLQQYRGQILEGVKAAWEPILDRTTWEAVRRHFGTPERRKGGRPAQFLLTGRIWCGQCERQRLFGRTKDGRRIYTCQPQRGGCNTLVSADHLEAYVSEKALELLDTTAVTAALIQASQDDGRVAALHAEHDKLVERQRELADQAANPDLPLAVTAQAAQAVEARLAEVKEELARVLPKRRLLALRWADTPEWSWYAPDMDDAERLAHRRALLGLVISKVVVKPLGHASAGKFDPSRVVIQPVEELTSDATTAAIVRAVLAARP